MENFFTETFDSKSVMINGNYYSSLSQTSKALNIHYKTVKNRIESSKWSQYQYIRINKK